MLADEVDAPWRADHGVRRSSKVLSEAPQGQRVSCLLRGQQRGIVAIDVEQSS
jgi:hypothetical protein